MKSRIKFELLDLFILVLVCAVSIFLPGLMKVLIAPEDHASWDRAQLFTFLVTLYAIVFTVACSLRVIVGRIWGTHVEFSTKCISWVMLSGILIVVLRHVLLGFATYYPYNLGNYSDIHDCLRRQTMYGLSSMPPFCGAGGIACWGTLRFFRKESDSTNLSLFAISVRSCAVLWLLIWIATPFLAWLPIPGLQYAGFPW